MNLGGESSKESCQCVICKMGVCPECGHLLWVHSKDGCLYSIHDATGMCCPCPVKRPELRTAPALPIVEHALS